MKMAFDDTPIFEMRSLDVLIDELKEDNNGEGPKSIDDFKPEELVIVKKFVGKKEKWI